MKLKFIYVLFFAAFSLLVLQSRSNGAAAGLNQDRTGSPISVGTCSACHSGGVFGTVIGITVKDGGGAIVTNYTPGLTYSVEFNVTSGTGFTYAMQGVALTAANAQAGSFGVPTSTNTKVTPLNGREYVEHSSPATGAGNFTFIVPWVAPTSGTGTVSFYGVGLTVNGNGGTSGDQVSSSTTISLSENAVATTIDYANATYCTNDANPSPVITGTQGGTFSSSPVGLSMNTSTGEINIGASTPGGPYTITYTYGAGNTTTDVLSVLAADNAQFTYGGNTWCQNDPTDPTPQGGPFSGTWTGTAGLVINSTTGVIDLSASTTGAHTVTYTTNGTCPNFNDLNITISAPEDASFSLSDSVFCQNGADGIATIAGTSGGTFSSTPSGLGLNASSGAIDVSISTAGTYTVTYTTSLGACGVSENTSITINAMDNAQFTLGGNSFCQDNADVTPVGGTPGGVWTGSAGLVVDSMTGTIDVSASTAGAHTITYTTNGQCPATNNSALTIVATDVASFTFTDTVYCANLGPNPFVTVSGSTSGTYSASPSGLVFADNTTGEIDINSVNGAYVVTYVSNGQCPVTVNANVTLALCSGLASLEQVEDHKLYPNPSKGAFVIENNGRSGDVSIRVLDILGKVVYQEERYFENGGSQQVELTNLTTGTYFVQLQKGDQVQTIKLNIE